MNPYENLANAIIIQAANDYLHAIEPTEITSIEKFFRSEYFSALTSVDPERLIKRLQEERKYDF